MITPVKCERCGAYPRSFKGHKLFKGLLLCPECLRRERDHNLSVGKMAPCKICGHLSYVKVQDQYPICSSCEEEMRKPNCSKCGQKLILVTETWTIRGYLYEGEAWRCEFCKRDVDLDRNKILLEKDRKRRNRRRVYFILVVLAIMLIIFFANVIVKKLIFL